MVVPTGVNTVWPGTLRNRRTSLRNSVPAPVIVAPLARAGAALQVARLRLAPGSHKSAPALARSLLPPQQLDVDVLEVGAARLDVADVQPGGEHVGEDRAELLVERVGHLDRAVDEAGAAGGQGRRERGDGVGEADPEG